MKGEWGLSIFTFQIASMTTLLPWGHYEWNKHYLNASTVIQLVQHRFQHLTAKWLAGEWHMQFIYHKQRYGDSSRERERENRIPWDFILLSRKASSSKGIQCFSWIFHLAFSKVWFTMGNWNYQKWRQGWGRVGFAKVRGSKVQL